MVAHNIKKPRNALHAFCIVFVQNELVVTMGDEKLYIILIGSDELFAETHTGTRNAAGVLTCFHCLRH